jgi:hypothetical protein
MGGCPISRFAHYIYPQIEEEQTKGGSFFGLAIGNRDASHHQSII